MNYSFIMKSRASSSLKLIHGMRYLLEKYALLGVLGLSACQTAGSPELIEPVTPKTLVATEAEEDPTTLDGVYTVAQAQRGQELFDDVCSECHETDDLTDRAFQARWEGQSTFQLWYFINDRMPYDDPWSLSRQQVTDVMTYILQLNGLKTGDAEMGIDDDSIDDYWIVWEEGL